MQVKSRVIDSDLMTPNLFKDVLELFHQGYAERDTLGRLCSRSPSVVMFRQKVSQEGAFILTAIEAGMESALRPLVKREGCWESLREPTSLPRSQTVVFTPYESVTACEDALQWADVLYRCGLIDGYVGLHDYEVQPPERLMLDTVSRHCLDQPFVESILGRASSYDLYFKDEDTQEFYPVEDVCIWGGAILEHGFYHYLGQYIRVLDVNDKVEGQRRLLARSLRKALRHHYITTMSTMG